MRLNAVGVAAEPTEAMSATGLITTRRAGEIIDGDAGYVAGTYVMFEAGSEHRPRSESGGRMLGINQV